MLLFQTDSLELNELRSVPVTRRSLLLSAYSYKQGTQRNHLSDPQWSLIQSLVKHRYRLQPIFFLKKIKPTLTSDFTLQDLNILLSNYQCKTQFLCIEHGLNYLFTCATSIQIPLHCNKL